MTYKSFYYPNNKESIWKKFLEITKREGTTGSYKILQLIEEYVKQHDPGNPQQRLDVISNIGKPYMASTCQDCGRSPVFEGLKKGVWLKYCGLHWDNRQFSVYRKINKK